MLPEEIYAGSGSSANFKYTHPLSHGPVDDGSLRARLAYDLMTFMERSDCNYFLNPDNAAGYHPQYSDDEVDIMIIDGYYKEAEIMIEQRLAEHPNDEKTLFQKAFIQHLQDEYSKLLDREDKILASDPKNVNALINKGFALANLKREEEALQIADKALRIDPENLIALGNKAQLAKMLGKDELREQTLQQAYNVSAKHRMEQLKQEESKLLRDFESVFMALENTQSPFDEFNEKSGFAGSSSIHQRLNEYSPEKRRKTYLRRFLHVDFDKRHYYDERMLSYVLKRLLLMIPTLFGIMLISFVIIQFVPGGPVEKMIAQLQGHGTSATARFTGGGGDMGMGSAAMQSPAGKSSSYKGAQGLDPEFIKELEALYGFDKPAYERFFIMVKNYLSFDLGQSYYRDVGVLELVVEKMPVSISLGLWSTLIIYLISIPLGIRKAVQDGTPFDVWTSAAIFIGYAIPSFMFAILLIVLFAGGRYWDFFPLRGLTSDGWEDMTLLQQIRDYAWHMVLPTAAMVISGFAQKTMLTKNCFLDEIGKHYVLTARSKGLSENQVLYGHIFRNAMLIIIAGFPALFVAIFFTGSLLIEVIFSLDGLGLLSYESIINRDYPVVLGTLYVFSLMSLVMFLVRDLVYVWVDPRIDFNSREI